MFRNVSAGLHCTVSGTCDSMTLGPLPIAGRACSFQHYFFYESCFCVLLATNIIQLLHCMQLPLNATFFSETLRAYPINVFV